MIATDFTRDDCQLGRKRKTYNALVRDYRCNACGGRLAEYYDDGWRIHCARCGSVDFVTEHELQRQRSEAIEVLAGLPSELAATLK